MKYFKFLFTNLDLWYNGLITADFDSVNTGSIPVKSTKKLECGGMAYTVVLETIFCRFESDHFNKF